MALYSTSYFFFPVSGCSGLAAECWTRDRPGAGSTLTHGPLQATLSKLLTYCLLRPTQPPTVSEMGNE